MDIKLFSLFKQEVPESEKGKECILDCVQSFFPEAEDFNPFSSQKRMLLAISQSLRAADIVVIAVQSNMYNATKRLLTGALGMKLEENSKIAAKLSSRLSDGKMKQTTFDANIMFPEGAEIFPTDSGLNNGFALTAGGQHLIYLPIEAPRAEEVVYGSLYDYFKDICDEDVIDAALEQRHVSVIERTLEKLSENSIKLSVSCEAYEDFISSRIYDKKLKSGIVFDEEIPEKECPSIDDTFIYRARYIRDKHHAQYGIAFSRPRLEDEDEGKIVLVAIADENGTNVLRFYAEQGETDKKLFASAVDKVMLMLYDYNEYKNLSDDDSLPSEEDKLLRKAIAKITGIAVGASAIIGFVIALVSR